MAMDFSKPIFYINASIAASIFVVSIICLILTVLVYIKLKRIKDFRSKIMLVIFLIFIFHGCVFFYARIEQITGNFLEECTAVHLDLFAFSGLMTWVCVLSFDSWISTMFPSFFSKRENTIKICCVIYGICVQALVMVLPAIGFHTPGKHIKPFHNGSCYADARYGFFYYFFLPPLILCAQNVVFLLLAATSIKWNSKNELGNLTQVQRLRFLHTLYLFLISSTSLFFAQFFIYHFTEYYWLVHMYIESPTGIVVFLVFVVLRKKIRYEILAQLGCAAQKQNDTEAICDHEVNDAVCTYDCKTESVAYGDNN